MGASIRRPELRIGEVVMLEPGSKLGPYEIVSKLGAGGMGEVWRARDSRLERDVAIKVLPQDLAATADARARLEREARSISGLNHPNICTLYDIGHEGDVDYLVMEVIEGETLTARLAQGALSPDEILATATQVAEALDVAHRQGIIHRDLKPGNIMLTRSGAKLMDFGLARAVQPAQDAESRPDSPTLTHALTAEGTLVGTFAYMAPEQLEGGEADARCDIWALGCVIYEMATGARAFAGKSQASLIGSIMQSDPPSVTAAAPLIPPALDRIVKACLAKDPGERIQTAHDVKLQLQWVAEGGSLAGVPVPVATRRRHRERLAWSLVVVLGLVAAWGAFSVLTRQAPKTPVTRFTVGPEGGVLSMTWPRISPDGKQLAYQAVDSLGNVMIWIRPLDALVANPLPGTQGAGRPFWSPDSRYVAYFLNNQLKKVAIAGGPPQLVCETKSAADGTWGTQNVILFDGAAGDSIRQVSADGGVASPATYFDHDSGESQHAWPFFLPDGQHFLFVNLTTQNTPGLELKVGGLGEMEPVSLGLVGSRAEFAPPDLVLYTLDSTLMARRLDLGQWRWRGEPFPIAENVLTRGNGQANFSVSAGGVLVTMSGESSERNELVWVDRTGKRLGRAGKPAGYADLALSPDGKRLAYGLLDPRAGSQDIWVRDLERGVASRLTFGDANDIFPTWSPDGARIAYSTDAAGAYSVRAKRADGTGATDTLFARKFHAAVLDWSHDGSNLLVAGYPQGNPDLWVVPLDDEGEPRSLLDSRFSEDSGRFSPDGHWLAYNSTESGRTEVYVRAFPGPGGKWQISTDGGSEPAWRGDGKELFFRGGGGATMMAVPLAKGSGLEVGTPVKLFDATLARSEIQRNRYAVSSDGQRFLLNQPLESAGHEVFRVTLNWTAAIARR